MSAIALPDLSVRLPRLSCPPRLRLFCFPYAGRGASIFRLWKNQLPSDVDVCPVQIPGRESRLAEPPFESLGPLVEGLHETLSPYFDVPFAFFGHSMGALISFELARHLRRCHGPTPLSLFVSAHRAPQLPASRAPFHSLSQPALVQELRRFGGTPEMVFEDPELLALLLPAVRADLSICENYKYQSEDPLACPITVFGGLQDRLVSPEAHAAWRMQTSGSFTVRLFPGDHFYLHSAQDSLLLNLFLNLKDILSDLKGARPS